MKINVTQKETDPVPVEILAESIVEISKAMRKINESRLTRKAIVALIHDKSNLHKTKIEIVLNNLDELENNWLKPKRKS